MKIKCIQCDSDVHLFSMQTSEGWVAEGSCDKCGQPYLKKLPKTIELKDETTTNEA